jgi:hypothetical protein
MSVDSKRKDFHITVGTHPPSELRLDTDLSLVKAALLYADKAKLCSVASFTMLAAVSVTELKPKERLKLVEELAPVIIRDEQQVESLLSGLKIYKQIVAKKHLNRKELYVRMQLEKIIAETWKSLREQYQSMAESSGFHDIARAVESGLLELHTFNSQDGDELVIEFFNVLAEAISDSVTYPLFDELTGGLIRSGIQEGKIEVSELNIKRGRHARLAAHLLERLPLFDAAGMDEILDIRKELERPLIRFRSAMIKFSDNIKSASWDKNFSLEAEQVFYKEIEPAILDIEDAVKTNNYLSTLIRKVADKPLTIPAGSTLAVVVSRLSDLPDLVSQGLGVSLAAAPLIYDATKEWKEKQLKTEQNHLFFYYRARKELSE